MTSNIVQGGCTQPTSGPSSSSGGQSSGSAGAIAGAVGGLAQAAMNGNLVEAAKKMAIDAAKKELQKAATQLLTDLVSTPVAPKPPLPPRPAKGKVAPPGSAAAAAGAAILAELALQSQQSGASGNPTTGNGNPSAAPSNSGSSSRTQSPSSNSSAVAPKSDNLLGKLWNLPNTILGLAVGLTGQVVGMVLYPIGAFFEWITGKENYFSKFPTITPGHNAIQFHNNPFMFLGALTLGNVISYGPRTPYNELMYPNQPERGTYGDHEEQHTDQGEQLGPLYLPSNVLGLLWSVINDPGWDGHGPSNWNERGPQSCAPVVWRPHDEYVQEIENGCPRPRSA